MIDTLHHKMIEMYAGDSKRIQHLTKVHSHHHTYDNIEGIDYQILVEADFLERNEK